ncbi:MAG TPA: carboxypeptidase-like regulatory domain-containing protein, partial [Hanamia sp.]|nr:carboxypeptidase-like regulatory domain-containing protein [Hanamia sp.]
MRKFTKILILAFSSILVCPFGAVAQSGVEGTVIDAVTGNPLVGASVTVRGTKTSALTNADGKFSLPPTSINRKLEITYVGYASQTVSAADNLVIKLVLDNSRLSEVIVSGLATTIKRSNSANAVASVSSKELVGTA